MTVSYTYSLEQKVKLYQEKAEKWDKDGVITARYKEELEQENKQLKEELNVMTRSELQMANKWATLKQKLEKLEEYVNDDMNFTSGNTDEIGQQHIQYKLKEILESRNEVDPNSSI